MAAAVVHRALASVVRWRYAVVLAISAVKRRLKLVGLRQVAHLCLSTQLHLLGCVMAVLYVSLEARLAQAAVRQEAASMCEEGRAVLVSAAVCVW